MNIRETTKVILAAESPAEWLRLADMYISSFNQMPEVFVLPSEHVVLSPVIKSFRSDPGTFVKYIKAIRDQFPPGDQNAELQSLYRTILTRVVQQSRRLRMGRALEVVEIICRRRLVPDERARVARNLEQHWACRRNEHLKAARSKTHKSRIGPDERAEQVHEFWEIVDGEIGRGEVNGWDDEVIDDLTLRF